MLLGDRRVTIYLSCGREDSPRYFRLAAGDAILFLIWHHADLFDILSCTKYCKREHLDGLAECFAPVDTL